MNLFGSESVNMLKRSKVKKGTLSTLSAVTYVVLKQFEEYNATQRFKNFEQL